MTQQAILDALTEHLDEARRNHDKFDSITQVVAYARLRLDAALKALNQKQTAANTKEATRRLIQTAAICIRGILDRELNVPDPKTTAADTT